jgi:outer membrane PBP1 activator LpoA protein
MQLAEKAWVDGHTKAIALTPQGNWGERVFSSFKNRFIGLGGEIVERQVYNTNEHDFSVPIKALLNIDESYERRRSMRNALGRKIEFEPYRRQDANFIFLLAKSRLARQIRPQLQFHHASRLPVYTTSHSYSGRPDPKRDQDLEGVVFPDIPWLVLNEGKQPLSRELIQETLATKSASYGRLYAMGIDSYKIIPHLSRLRSSSRETLDGKTGMLSMGAENQIHRQLVWAKMKQGIPEIIGYAPKLEQKRTYTAPSHSPGRSSDFFSW